MYKAAIIDDKSFLKYATNTSFDEKIDLKNIVEYVEFTNATDLHRIYVKTFGNNFDAIFTNYNYNEKYVIQTVHSENTHRTIFVKQLVDDKITYTFANFNPNDQSTDNYNFCSIFEDDMINLIKLQYIVKSVYVPSNVKVNELGEITGNIANEEVIIHQKPDDDVGILKLKNLKTEWKYLNCANVIEKCKKENKNTNENMILEVMAQKVNAYYTKYMYKQCSVGFCIINCFYNCYGEEKNELLSLLFGQDIFGDGIIYIHDSVENDSSKILQLDVDVLGKIVKKISNSKKHKTKNQHFYNLYFELDN